jgi:hypothetical protein
MLLGRWECEMHAVFVVVECSRFLGYYLDAWCQTFFVFQQLESIELFLVFVAKRVVPNLLLL